MHMKTLGLCTIHKFNSILNTVSKHYSIWVTNPGSAVRYLYLWVEKLALIYCVYYYSVFVLASHSRVLIMYTTKYHSYTVLQLKSKVLNIYW